MSQQTATPAVDRPAVASPPLTGPLLVAVGGTHARGVLRAARRLPPGPGGVLAVAVLEPLPVYAVDTAPILPPPGFYEERLDTVTESLTREVREVAGTDTRWRTSVIDGAPADALTALARTIHAPLLVMGLGRHRPLDRILGAETTVHAIGRAPCPVLAVHPDVVPPFHEVVVAVDFSVASAHAAEVVIPLLAATATLHLLHIWTPAAEHDPRLVMSDDAYVLALPDRFDRLLSNLSVPAGVTVKTVTREGKGAEPILDYADSHHADLIVAGRHGLSVFRRLLVGSVTTALLRGADRSVLVAPEPPFADADRLRRILTGHSESTNPAEWEAQLAEFARRNHGRTVELEVDDQSYGAQVSESGYKLLGAAYDPRERRVELILGDPDRDARRVTRRMVGVDTIRITADAGGRDASLRISHGGGETALAFTGV